jgi:TPR repeat protein
METNYYALRIIAIISKVVAVGVGIVALLVVVMLTRTASELSNPYLRFAVLAVGLFTALMLWAGAELINVFLDIEGNTRRAADAVGSDTSKTQPAYLANNRYKQVDTDNFNGTLQSLRAPQVDCAAIHLCDRSDPAQARFSPEQFRAIRQAANEGHADSQVTIGNLYCQGEEVVQNYSKAAEWFLKAADQENADAQLRIGQLYLTGQGVQKDESKAAHWFAKAVANGNVAAYRNLGFRYLKGEGLPQNYGEALKWFRKGADQGDADCYDALGKVYEGALGVPRDYAEAVKWYRREAEAGRAIGQYNLAECLYCGRGVNVNFEEAAVWYKKAAEQGLRQAQSVLGDLYRDGEGVDRDRARAYLWYSLAATSGDTDAIKDFEELKQTMNPDEIRTGNDLSAAHGNKTSMAAKA